jgi:hypothetical protein
MDRYRSAWRRSFAAFHSASRRNSCRPRGVPLFGGGLPDRWLGFHRARISNEQTRGEAQRLTQLLWSLRTDDGLARDFVGA